MRSASPGILRAAFLCLAALCLLPWVSPALALCGGLALAVLLGNPFIDRTRALTPRLLALCVIGLGAEMNLGQVMKVGAHGFVYTLAGIATCLLLGLLLTRLLRVPGDAGILISVGTAICGGSAIAAVAPAIRAKDHDISMSLATVFFLNAAALLIFPPIGHALHLDGLRFGLWDAIAIHDTSSVVGAATAYGDGAVVIATTVKLARALWIVPVTIGFTLWRDRTRAEGVETAGVPKAKPKRPWFILGYVIAAGLVTALPQLATAGHWVALAAKRGLVLTLFLIGANLTRKALKAVGVRPFVLGVSLWLLMASVSLLAVVRGWLA